MLLQSIIIALILKQKKKKKYYIKEKIAKQLNRYENIWEKCEEKVFTENINIDLKIFEMTEKS